jgi:hypothetical protein
MERMLVTVLALLAATPAAAGERIAYAPAPDAMSLLMQDARATFAAHDILIVAELRPMLTTPELRGFAMRDADATALARTPHRLDLSGFEALSVSTLADVPPRAWAPVLPPEFALSGLPGWQRSFASSVPADDGGRYAVREAIGVNRLVRRPRALDATLVLHLDGNADSPALSVGGGITAALWQAIPKE